MREWFDMPTVMDWWAFSEMSRISSANKQDAKGHNPTLWEYTDFPPQIMRLPYEIRRQIYHYLIPRDLTIDLHEANKTLASKHYQQCHRLLCIQYNNYQKTKQLEQQQQQPPKEVNYWTSWRKRNSQYRGSDLKFIPEIEMPVSKSKNSVMRICRHISSDVLDALYGDNTFIFKLHDITKIPNLNAMKWNAARMRRVEVTIRHSSGPIGSRFDEELWSLILPGLASLKIIVVRAEMLKSRSQAELQNEMDRWLEWMMGVFRQFASYLSSKTIVEIEDRDGKLEIADLLKQCLP